MARTSWCPELGKLPANKGGTHGGINPAGGSGESSHKTEGSSGNPGTQLPWEGADATPKPDDIPPLTHL